MVLFGRVADDGGVVVVLVGSAAAAAAAAAARCGNPIHLRDTPRD